MAGEHPSSMRSLDDIGACFTYHRPNTAQVATMVELRDTAGRLAELIVVGVPECPDRTAALRKLRECIMAANAAIVLDNVIEGGE